MNDHKTSCRVCTAEILAPAYDEAGPSLTSIRTVLDIRTQVWLCETCGHAQCPDLPDVTEFYDTQYRISLDIDGHDQLYENAAGEQVFRTAYQAELVLALNIANYAMVLDFGAGKATTLQRLVKARPDIVPHVYDVSADYLEHWNEWVPAGQVATYELPKTWARKFDLITAHFVLEHVADPVEVLSELACCLAPNGRLFFSVPDVDGNSGDLLVVDHLNHFTNASVVTALDRAGLVVESIDRKAFSGAFVIVAKAGNNSTYSKSEVANLRTTLSEWKGILSGLSEMKPNGPVAIYGAGFYGSMISIRLPESPRCFLDRNPYLQDQIHLNTPIISPENCPSDVTDVIVGLNPARAREILTDTESWLPKGAQLIYFGGD